MSTSNASLQAKINDKSAVIGVMALGYVGLPLIRTFWDAGFRVIGFDTDPEKIAMLRRGENYLRHFGEDFVAEMVGGGASGGRGEAAALGEQFDVTDDMSRLDEPDVICVCVPTPLGAHLEPDLQYVERSAEAIARCLRKDQLVVLESTTFPGTTRDVVLPRLACSGLTCGEDFYLAYSPERENPGSKRHTTRTIPKLIGGIDSASGELAAALYRHAVTEVVPVASTEIAEAAKLLENVYRAVNIALVNELKMILTRMGIDVWAVIDAASTKPFGFQPFYPGPGLGGHCIPIDPFYLTWKAREVDQPTRFIELAGQINRQMPAYVVHRTMLALNERAKAVKNARVLVLGLAYKPNVDDVRESPSFEIIERLRALGAHVDYHDPHVPATHRMRQYDLQMTSIDLTAAAVRGYDCLIIATNHDFYDWSWIAEHAPLVVDTRGAMRHLDDGDGDGETAHIVQA